MTAERCNWNKCRSVPALRYLGRLLCLAHWDRTCGLLQAGRWNTVARATGIAPEQAERAADLPATQESETHVAV